MPHVDIELEDNKQFISNIPRILEESIFDFRYVRLYDVEIPKEKMVELLANSGDPDQTPRSAASDRGLHCLPVTLLGISSLRRVKGSMFLKNRHFIIREK